MKNILSQFRSRKVAGKFILKYNRNRVNLIQTLNHTLLDNLPNQITSPNPLLAVSLVLRKITNEETTMAENSFQILNQTKFPRQVTKNQNRNIHSRRQIPDQYPNTLNLVLKRTILPPTRNIHNLSLNIRNLKFLILNRTTQIHSLNRTIRILYQSQIHIPSLNLNTLIPIRNLADQTNLQSLEEGRRLTEDGKKILNLLIEIDQKHIEILRNNMKKLSNDRLIYKLKERLTNVELKLLEDSMSEVDKNQMIIDKQILEKDSHDLLVEKSVIEAQKDIFVIEKKMLELLVSIKETAIKIDENKVELANSRGKSRTEIQHLQNGIATLERQQRADQSEWAIFKMSHKQAHIQRELLLIENRLNGEKRNVTRHLLMAQRDLFRAELSLIEIDLKVLDDYKLAQETSRQVDMRLMEWAKEWERKTGEMKANWNDMRKAIEHDSNIITKLIDQRFSPDYYK
ncbi:hypothetical protein WR25_07432 [Diploscapter pachys]|uniref:Uncharacterized protein n=1 Tax=Diploscapter pachys TaxID=2018661 RepID=A0A2A2JT80_9BILA|nr:hypothetical protein WR25_07432 [Diploscapter pachys]